MTTQIGGDRFERLMQAFLRTDDKYAQKFREVWLWNEFFGRESLGGHDLGIDLVALTHEGEYWAIQCKCYRENATIDKPAVDSFLTTSNRWWKGEDAEEHSFAHRLWIDTADHWSVHAEETIKNQQIQLSRIGLSYLREAKVDWEKLDRGIFGQVARNPKNEYICHRYIILICFLL